MIQHIFFDFDGVLTLNKNGSTIFCQQLALATGSDFSTILDAWYNASFDLLIGETEYKDIWSGFCAEAGISVSIDELPSFHQATPKNEEMFELVRNIKKQGISCGIITDNPIERMQALITTWGLDHTFSPIVVSANVGSLKDTKNIFEVALTEADIKPEQAIFIDNTEKNLIVPKIMGIQTHYHDEYLNDIDVLSKFLLSHDIDVNKA